MRHCCWRIIWIAVLLVQPVSVITSSQGQLPPVVQQANAEYGKGNFKEAAALFQDALDHPPAEYGEMPPQFKSYLYSQIGACYTQLARYEEAVAALTRAASLYQYAATYGWLGRAYIMLPNFPESAPNYQKAIDLDPGSCVNYAGLAIAGSRSGQYDVAQKAVEGSRGKKCAEDDQYALQSAQLLPLLAGQKYDEAHQLVGDRNQISVDLRVATGVVGILYLFQGGPAQLGGLEVGDVFEAVNDQPIHSPEALTAALDAVPFGSTVAIRINRNGSVQEKYVIAGIPPNLPELAAAANQPFPGTAPAPPSGKPAANSVSGTAAPALAINRVDVKPAVVRPGEPFTLEISFTGIAKGVIIFSFNISAGDMIVFSSKPGMLESGSGVASLVTRNLTAASEPGKYTFHLQMSLDDTKVTGETTLTVEKHE